MYSHFDGQYRQYRPLKTKVNEVVLDDRLTNLNCRFKTIKVMGREALEEEHQAQTIIGRDGAYYLGSRRATRIIEVLCVLEAKDRVSLTQGFRQLYQLLSSKAPASLSFSDDEGYFYWAKYQSTGNPDVMRDSSVFTIQFVCYDPYKYSDYRSGNGASLTYHGDIGAKPKVTMRLTSAGSELRLLHVQQQLYIRLVGVFSIGQVVVIDMETRSILIDGRSAMTMLDMVNSRFFRLIKGSNRLNCNLASQIDITYREVLLC